jgi:hypothetical protein
VTWQGNVTWFGVAEDDRRTGLDGCEVKGPNVDEPWRGGLAVSTSDVGMRSNGGDQWWSKR